MEKKNGHHRYFRPDELRILREIGFTETEMDGFFTHAWFGDKLFDFTALSVYGVIKSVWNDGKINGIEIMRSEFRKLMDIR